MPPDINVTIDDVRTSLSNIDGDIDDGALPDETIEQAIKHETIVVYGQLPEDWDARLAPRLEGTPYDPVDALEILVIRKAARKAFNSSPTVVRKQALDAAVSYDVQSFRGQLRRNVDEIYDLLGLTRGGSSAPIAEATRHAATDGDTEERLRNAEGRGRRRG